MDVVENIYDNVKGQLNDSDDVKKALDNVLVILEDNLSEDAYVLSEDAALVMANAYERQGFVNGFQYAMQLSAETFCKETILADRA